MLPRYVTMEVTNQIIRYSSVILLIDNSLERMCLKISIAQTFPNFRKILLPIRNKITILHFVHWLDLHLFFLFIIPKISIIILLRNNSKFVIFESHFWNHFWFELVEILLRIFIKYQQIVFPKNHHFYVISYRSNLQTNCIKRNLSSLSLSSIYYISNIWASNI